MSRKKIMFFSIVFMIIILILILLLIIILKNKINNTEQIENGSSILDEYVNIENNSISQNSYFDINSCIAEYLDNLNIQKSSYYGRDKNGKFILIVEEKQIKQNIYDLLSENYINKNNITLENLYDHVKVLEKQVLFVPLEASVIQSTDVTRFLVHGLVETMDLKVIDEIFLIVNIDAAKETFSIEPIKGDYTSINDIEVKHVEEKIEVNTNNKFSRYSVSYETTAKDYINLYKRLALGSPEKLYYLLDEEYRNARFGSVEELEKYINTNRKKIQGIRVEKYQVNEKDDYTQYLCVDQNNNYYIFRENRILDYSIILDTYSVELPEFIEKYESSADNIKVALNIEKLVEASKMGDYKYIYNKLDESFRLNNFKSLNEFEKFMQGKFDATVDTIEYDKYQKVTGVHVYNIIVTDKSENKTINAKVVMDLKENRDFVFSFSVAN